MSYPGSRVLGGVSVMIALAIMSGSIRVTAARANVINTNPCNGAVITQPFARGRIRNGTSSPRAETSSSRHGH